MIVYYPEDQIANMCEPYPLLSFIHVGATLIVWSYQVDLVYWKLQEVDHTK